MADSQEAGQEVRITHVFDAPRERVFEAWTDPGQVAQWWRPEGFDIPVDTVEIDARAGGRYDMTFVQAEGGAEFRQRAEVVEIAEPELIVLRNEPIPEAGLTEETMTRVESHDEGGKTRMVVTDGPYSEEIRANAEAGRREAIGKLERLLAA